MVTHTGEKRFECKTCGNKFSLKASLTQHLKLHSNDESHLHKCKDCPMKFTVKSNLTQHIQAIHLKDDVEKIVAEIEKEEQQKLAVVEAVTERPLKRSSFAFVAHPEKDELILFGGEFFNGQRATMFNDLLFYNIAKGDWTCLKIPGGPAPRSGHQMVAVPGGKGGQLWIFGGEFSSASQSQFYHYKDLWVLHLGERKWQKINVSGGPQARSGHRMVLCKKQLILFGGYHDNTMDYKYFNDIYAFDLKDYKWRKLEPTGTAPAARSGCQMATLPSSKILISGGYSRQKVKKDVDKGVAHTDSFLLTPDKGDESGTKWKWSQVKTGGVSPYPRSGMAFTVAPGGRGMAFGGVCDEEGDEDLSGTFNNELYSMDLERTTWRLVSLSGKKEGVKSRRRRRKEGGEEEEGSEEESQDMEEETPAEPQVTSDDGIFKVTVGPSLGADITSPVETISSVSTAFVPSPRMNSGLAFKQGKLFMYGGLVEEGDKQITLSDMYSLDLHKMDEWHTILEPEKSQEWLDSSSDSEGDDDSGSEEDEEDGSDESPMDTA